MSSMCGDTAIYVFLKTVEGITNVNRENMFALTNNDKYICFSPNGFRAALRFVIISEKLEEKLQAKSSNQDKIIRELLQVFRTLGLIIAIMIKDSHRRSESMALYDGQSLWMQISMNF